MLGNTAGGVERKHTTAITYLKVNQHLIMEGFKIYKWCKTLNMQHQHKKKANSQNQFNGLIFITHKSHRGLKSHSFAEQKLKSNKKKKKHHKRNSFFNAQQRGR